MTTTSRANGRWKVATNRGTLAAADLLVATNGYTDEGARWLRRRLVPIGSYIIATEPLSADHAAALIPKRRMVFDTRHFLHYYRVTADQRMLFGGRAQFARPKGDAIGRAAAVLHHDMVGVFPSLASTRIEYAWGGNVAFTRDLLPHAGRFGEAHYSAGYCGHGVAMGTYLGATIARVMAGEQADCPLLDRPFRPVPLYRATRWFLPVVGACYKLLDYLS